MLANIMQWIQNNRWTRTHLFIKCNILFQGIAWLNSWIYFQGYQVANVFGNSSLTFDIVWLNNCTFEAALRDFLCRDMSNSVRRPCKASKKCTYSTGIIDIYAGWTFNIEKNHFASYVLAFFSRVRFQTSSYSVLIFLLKSPLILFLSIKWR